MKLIDETGAPLPENGAPGSDLEYGNEFDALILTRPGHDPVVSVAVPYSMPFSVDYYEHTSPEGYKGNHTLIVPLSGLLNEYLTENDDPQELLRLARQLRAFADQCEEAVAEDKPKG